MVLVVGLFFWFEQKAESHTQNKIVADEDVSLNQEIQKLLGQKLLEQHKNNPEALKKALAQAQNLREKTNFVLHNAAFYGLSSNGKKWRVEAEKAIQSEGEKSIYLEGLHTTVTGQSQQEVALYAETGILNDEQDVLILKEGFTGKVHDYLTKGQAAEYWLNQQKIQGDVLRVTGADMKLVAQVFNAELNQQKALFDEGVRMKMNLSRFKIK